MVSSSAPKASGCFSAHKIRDDVPTAVLSQSGLKVHTYRAFTAKDRKGIKLAAENFPITEYYQVDELLTQMGIGEALVTALDEKGIPMPLVHTYLRAPQSRMDVLSDAEVREIVSSSKLVNKYNTELYRESAYELLNEKLAEAEEAAEKAELQRNKWR